MGGWDALPGHVKNAGARSIKSLFDTDPARFADFSVTLGDFLMDFSKCNIDRPTLAALLDIAAQARVADRRDAMFAGGKINETENRAVLHTALRNLDGAPVLVDGTDVMPGVRATLGRMRTFAGRVRAGAHQGAGGTMTDVVHIGTGGSYLGPAMATRALSPCHDGPGVHFVTNADGADSADTLKALNPATTLVLIASKTFTTTETMMNAKTARSWLLAAIPQSRLGAHMVALSSADGRAAAFGVHPDHVFGFQDWVGGRTSVWGAVGLSLMLAIGPENFRMFLEGGQAMDRHFQTAPLAANMPVLLALTGIWHAGACGYDTRAVLPYDQRLARLPAYLQQLDMESNGKGVAMDGSPLRHHSGPIIWGEPGTGGQHAFYQSLHQGTRIIPCEFLIARTGHEPELAHQHRFLLANCLAQSEALLLGRSLECARAMMAARGLEGAELERQAAHRVFPGNRPSVTMLYDRLTPRTLGMIIALYEHRVFVEGVIWGINSFDQWGVELGKELALSLMPVLTGERDGADRDASTRMLARSIRRGQA
ncbi:MAG: glucose-6-phosphate isomerase [Rhodobacteraceae bacterium]|nr:glucose-6-phosphate isomerase [Paracoccaceae bacterium]